MAIICLIASGCSRVPQSPRPTPLLDGIMSYQTFSQIKLLPKLKTAKWKVIKFSRLDKSGKRPCFYYLSAETNYIHLGFDGKATFVFYKGRLMDTVFDLSDSSTSSSYQNVLSKSLGINFNSAGYTYLDNTEIHSAKTRKNKNKYYVSWSDAILSEEWDEGIKQCS